MRSVFLRFSFFLLFFGAQFTVLAQNKSLDIRLDSLQKANDLSGWIYERLEYAKNNPQANLTFLLQTQAKLWRKAKNQTEHFAYLDLLNVQGYHQLLTGNILGSINSYESAFAYYLKNEVVDYEIVDYTLKPLSNNYTRLGDYERALYLQRRTLNFQLKNQYPPTDIASMYGNMAICYQSMGNLAEAEKNVGEGLKLAAKDAQTRLVLRNVLAGIFFERKEYQKAAQLIEANISAQRQNLTAESAYWLASSFSTAGNIYMALNQPQKADAYLSKAIDLLNRYYPNKWLRERANLFTQKGRLKLRQQQPLQAIQFFDKTLLTLKIKDGNNNLITQRIYGDNRVMEVFEQLALAHQQLKQADLAIKYIKLALLAGDKIRNEFADDETKERLQADLKNTAEKGIEISYQLYQQTHEKYLLHEILIFAEQSKSRTLLDQIRRNQQLMGLNQKDSLFVKKRNLELAITYQEKQELEGIASASQHIAGLKYDLALINKQLQQKYRQLQTASPAFATSLPTQRTLEYFVGEQAIYLLDMGNGQINSVQSLPDAPQVKLAIQTYVNAYFQHGPNAMLNSPRAFYLASYQLYKTILQGVHLNKGESLTIIPDGILGYVSFDGLLTNNQYSPNISAWPFLIKNNTITYAFSLQTLSANAKKNKQEGFAGFFITHQQNNNAPLKAVQAEADGLKKLIRGRFLFNEQANAKSFKKEFGRNQVLHIGTHAYLSGTNQEPTLDFGPEKLFLFELTAQQKAPSLVVLSACRTADGLLANGEGIISLSRGFNAIGTSATIAGLWNVNDVAASVITRNFYKNLLNGENNGQALHRAKLDWLEMPQHNDALYLPYYWDSLIYMGTDQQINLATPFHWPWVTGIGVLILLMTIALIWFRKKEHRLHKRTISNT